MKVTIKSKEPASVWEGVKLPTLAKYIGPSRGICIMLVSNVTLGIKAGLTGTVVASSEGYHWPVGEYYKNWVTDQFLPCQAGTSVTITQD